jgi:diguanylate cyclase (GGDEF)-like protein
LLSFNLAAEDYLVLDSENNYDLKEHITFYEDKSKSLTITDILKPEIQNLFQPGAKSIPDFGLTRSAVWGRLAVQTTNQTTRAPGQIWYLMFPFNMDKVDIYYPDKDGTYLVKKGGEDIPYNKRPVTFNQHLFEIYPEQTLKTIYFRAESKIDKVILNPVILSPMGLVNFSAKDKTIHALYLGIILSIIIYNGFIFFTFRDKAYAFYIFYLMFNSFALLLGFNFLNSIFFPNSTGLYFPVSYFAITCSLFFSIQFLRSFLYTRINLPRLDNALKWISFSLLPFFLIYFINARFFINIFYVIIIVVPLLMIYTGVKLYSKYVYAKIYTNAWIVYVVTIVIYSLQFFSVIPFISRYLLEIGQGIEATILSIAMSYKMKELHHRANRDFLTGLFNRSSFQDYLSRQIALINSDTKKNRETSLLILDLDDFKSINDIYGHGVGDKVLQALARLIPEHLRIQDFFCRWGGEEFVIIAPDTSLKNAVVIAEKLRTLIEAHDFPVVGKITASFGVAAYVQDESIRSFFQRADKALYVAKSKGKNKVEVLESLLEISAELT